ncbi:MAG: phosphatidylserine synthase, partial [Bacteroidetes bacterium]
PGWSTSISSLLPLTGLLIVVASGYRLAKFNVDTRQTDSFIGLPTPANALLILSFPLILELQPANWSDAIILNTWFLVGITLLSCILLNAEIRLFALKFKTPDIKTNAKRYIFLIICLISLVLLKFLAIPLIITVYILMSLMWRDRRNA